MRSVDAINALPLAPYVAFTLEDLSSQGFLGGQEVVRIVVRTADGFALAHPLRDFDGNTVRKEPEVVTTPVFPMTVMFRAGDFPLADFGMRRNATRPGVFDAIGTPAPATTDSLPLLATVIAISHRYEITDRGDTKLGKHDVFHIALKPLRDAGHNVLRELWVDKTTYLPVRYLAERFVDVRPVPFTYIVTVNDALMDGHLVNLNLFGNFEVHRGLLVNFSGTGNFRIYDVTFPEAVPDWAFDPSQYEAHRKDDVPGMNPGKNVATAAP